MKHFGYMPKFYFDNRMRFATLRSLYQASWTELDYILSDFLKLTTDLVAGTQAQLTGQFTEAQPVSDIVMAGHTCDAYRIQLYKENDWNGLLYDSGNIRNTRHIYAVDLKQTLQVKGIVITVFNSEYGDFKLGNIYIGPSYSFTKFITFPKWKDTMGGTNKRTNGGFSYGLQAADLRELAVEFKRVWNIDYKSFLKYAETVKDITPHFINLYPEDIDDVPIMWGTLNKVSDFEKRDENGFYYDFSANWKEAK